MVDIQVNNQTIAEIQLIIFDKDGTLMDLYHYWSQMIGLRAEFICQKLGLDGRHQGGLLYEMGVDYRAGRLRPEGPVGIKKREVVLQTAADYLTSIGHPNNYNLCLDVFKEVDQVSLVNLKEFIRPIDGANDLIDELFRNGCKMAIATTDMTERAKIAMEFLGFADKIDLVAGADMVINSKPDPEMIYMILDALDIDKTHAVMIGDAITDVQIGINADLRASIGVLTGFSSYEQLKAVTPYIIDSVGDIKLGNA